MSNKTTIHITLPQEMKQEMERVAREVGLPSVAAYVAFLHLAMYSAVQLNENERLLLRQLVLHQGSLPQQKTPSALDIARRTRLTPDYIPVATRMLEKRKLVQTNRTPPDKHFHMDFMLPDGTHVEVTPLGMAVAQLAWSLATRLKRSVAFERIPIQHARNIRS